MGENGGKGGKSGGEQGKNGGKGSERRRRRNLSIVEEICNDDPIMSVDDDFEVFETSQTFVPLTGEDPPLAPPTPFPTTTRAPVQSPTASPEKTNAPTSAQPTASPTLAPVSPTVSNDDDATNNSIDVSGDDIVALDDDGPVESDDDYSISNEGTNRQGPGDDLIPGSTPTTSPVVPTLSPSVDDDQIITNEDFRVPTNDD